MFDRLSADEKICLVGIPTGFAVMYFGLSTAASGAVALLAAFWSVFAFFTLGIFFRLLQKNIPYALTVLSLSFAVAYALNTIAVPLLVFLCFALPVAIFLFWLYLVFKAISNEPPQNLHD